MAFFNMLGSDYMSNLSYRVYSSYQGWKLIGIKTEIQSVINLIKDHIYSENAQYIVIEHHNDLNMDIPFKSIASEEEFIEFQNEYKENKKELIK